jgi:hypothetical protein
MKKEIVQAISGNIEKIIQKSFDSTSKGGFDRKKFASAIVDGVTDIIPSGKSGGEANSSQGQSQGQGQGKSRGQGQGQGCGSGQGRGRGGKGQGAGAR